MRISGIWRCRRTLLGWQRLRPVLPCRDGPTLAGGGHTWVASWEDSAPAASGGWGGWRTAG